MSNGKWCCVLGVCCDPGTPEQLDAFVEEFLHDLGAKATDTAVVRSVGVWVLKSFDLAPKGTIEPFRQAILEQVRKSQK